MCSKLKEVGLIYIKYFKTLIPNYFHKSHITDYPEFLTWSWRYFVVNFNYRIKCETKIKITIISFYHTEKLTIIV